MTPKQARAVLRATAEAALSCIELLYGLTYGPRAAELIKEALIVDRAQGDKK